MRRVASGKGKDTWNQIHKKIVALALSGLTLGAVFAQGVPALAALAETKQSVNFRAKATTKSEILGKLSEGTTTDVISYGKVWSKISHGGQTGYVSTKYLNFYSRGIIRSRVNLRSQPSKEGDFITKIPAGEEVIVYDGDSSGWQRVQWKEQVGYVHGSYVTPKEETEKTYAKGEKIMLTAAILRYMTAADAAVSKNSVGKYAAGTYYVYRSSENKMINISKIKGTVGAWVNPKDIVSEDSLGSIANQRMDWSHQDAIAGHYPWIAEYEGHWAYPGNDLYLTMDFGYEYGFTAQILDTLKAKGVKATLFVTTEYMRDNPELVRRMVEEGHRVGNHSTGHINMVNLVGSDGKMLVENTKAWEKTFLEITGKTSKLYRAPEGVFSKRGMKVLKDMGYATIFWGAAYYDYNMEDQLSLSEAKKAIYPYCQPGRVILLHPMATNAELLPIFIDDMTEKGLSFDLVPNP